eukprot:6490934-Amphidinium_carterae.2
MLVCALGVCMQYQPPKEVTEEEMTHRGETNREIRGSARVETLGTQGIPTNQITPGLAQVVLEEPVADHPVGTKPLVVHLRAVAVATGSMTSDGRLEEVVEEASIHLILMEEAIAEIKVTGNHETGTEIEARCPTIPSYAVKESDTGQAQTCCSEAGSW